MSRLASSRPIWSCLVLFCLVLSCLVVSCRVVSCRVVSCLQLVFSCLVLSRLVLSCLVVSCLVLSCLMPLASIAIWVQILAKHNFPERIIAFLRQQNAPQQLCRMKLKRSTVRIGPKTHLGFDSPPCVRILAPKGPCPGPWGPGWTCGGPFAPPGP